MGIDGRRILVTGGAVHGNLDAVKIVTNRFKGGMIAALADGLADAGFEVVWLSGKDSKVPKNASGRVETLVHDGFWDYKDKVAALAPTVHGVFLGAAVANLIPCNPWKGKFPSHDYKPGDRIPIDFEIAPRVVDEVRSVAPKSVLAACKLLSGVSDGELVEAAFEIAQWSGARMVMANDAKNLGRKLMVMREGSVLERDTNGALDELIRLFSDDWFGTNATGEAADDLLAGAKESLGPLLERCESMGGFVKRGPFVFGSVARMTPGGMLCTSRGKDETESFAFVRDVDFENKGVLLAKGSKKASLNAPLLWRIMKETGSSWVIHGHRQLPDVETQPYAPPGGLMDSTRPVSRAFNVEGHGFFLAGD